MKIKTISAAALLILSIACTSTEEYTKAENATDAGREFVRAALDGDYLRASFYLLKDSTNQLLFERQKKNYDQLSPKEKKAYQESSIRPVGIIVENDSTTIFRYYHSANPTDTTPLRIIKFQGDWMVDL
ncbi:MAG: hypothetical protein ACKVOW_09335, partial [Chitinophagaceae bacterium]